MMRRPQTAENGQASGQVINLTDIKCEKKRANINQGDENVKVKGG